MRVCLAWEGDRIQAAFPLVERNHRLLAGMATSTVPCSSRPVGRSPEPSARWSMQHWARRPATFSCPRSRRAIRRSRSLSEAAAAAGRRHVLAASTSPHRRAPREPTRTGGRPRSPAGARRSSASAQMARDHEAELSIVEPPADLDASRQRVRRRGERLEGRERHRDRLGRANPDLLSRDRALLRGARPAAPVADRARRRVGGVRPVPAPWRPPLPAEDRLRRALCRLAPGLVMRLSIVERCFELGLRAHELLGDESEWSSEVRDRRAQPRGLPRVPARVAGEPRLQLSRHGPAAAEARLRRKAGAAAQASSSRKPGSPVSSGTSICAFCSLPA